MENGGDLPGGLPGSFAQGSGKERQVLMAWRQDVMLLVTRTVVRSSDAHANNPLRQLACTALAAGPTQWAVP
jgi:hypothetical protein